MQREINKLWQFILKQELKHRLRTILTTSNKRKTFLLFENLKSSY